MKNTRKLSQTITLFWRWIPELEDFHMQENIGMTSVGRGKFSTDFNTQSNESSAAKHSLQ